MSGPVSHDIDCFDEQFDRKGSVQLDGVVPSENLKAIREAVLKSVADCGRRQIEGGATTSPDGTAHHSVGQYAALDAFLEQDWVDDLVHIILAGVPTSSMRLTPPASGRQSRATSTASTVTYGLSVAASD